MTVLIDPPALFGLVRSFLMLMAVFVLIWAIWSGWKKKANVTESAKTKRILGIFTFITLFSGTVEFLLDVAYSFKLAAMTKFGEAQDALFKISIAESLYNLSIALGLAGVMLLVYLTMPWNKKSKELKEESPTKP